MNVRRLPRTPSDRPRTKRGDPQRGLSRLALGSGLLALCLAIVRWVRQGTSTVYTDLDRSFYLPDPILGWRETQETWTWLGLDAVLALAACVVGTWFAQRLAARRPHAPWRFMRAASRVVCVIAPVPVIAVMLSGLPASEARAFLPSQGAAPEPGPPETAAAVASPTRDPQHGYIPAGRYTVAPHASNLLIAKLNAGGEAFEGKFKPLTGFVTFDLAAPADGEFKLRIQAPTGSIETGIALRNEHAATDLKAKQHPALILESSTLQSLAPSAGGGVSFRLTGRLGLMGRTLELPVNGTLQHLDSSARSRLGLSDAVALLVNASLTVPITATSLDPSSFDATTVPVMARFILVPAAH